MSRSNGMWMRWGCVLFCFLFCFNLLFADPWPGGGTEASPYEIGSKIELLYLSDHSEYWDDCFILVNHINLTGELFGAALLGTDENIYDGSFQGTAFTGSFDGNGYIISNFTIDLGIGYDATDHIGFWGYLGAGAEINNVHLVNVLIDSVQKVLSSSGGLAGENHGSVTNCVMEGIRVDTTDGPIGSIRLGGLIGLNHGVVSDCQVSDAQISTSMGGSSLGGLIGCNKDTVTRCSASGGSGNGDAGVGTTGGLVGLNDGVISESYSIAFAGGEFDAGSLVGVNVATIQNCFATGFASAWSHSVGGLAGSNSGTIENCYSTGSVGGGAVYPYLGGLVGYNNGNVNNCYWDIETSGLDFSDGGTGLPTKAMKIKNMYTSIGWDFTTVWNIREDVSYPYFRWAEDAVCGDLEHYPYPAGDINMDCVVNLNDVCALSENWLMDVRP